jgi:diguanylate cyclase (GGDEF)-like protein
MNKSHGRRDKATGLYPRGVAADKAAVRRILLAPFPAASGLGRGQQALLLAGFAVLFAMLGATAVNAVFGLGGVPVEHFMRDWVSSAVYMLVAGLVVLRAWRLSSKRAAWALFATGLSLYGLGNVLWSLWIEHLKDVPFPSICDALWLTLYPTFYVGIVLFSGFNGRRKAPAGVWLDGLMAGAGLAALGAALVFRPVLDATSGSTVAIATELAYPIGDLLLGALVIGLLALRGWHLDRVWALLGAGFLALSLADILYAVQVAGGSSSPSSITNLVYVVAVGLLAAAAWQPEPSQRAARVNSASALLIPGASALIALGLLVFDHFTRLDPLAFALAIVTLGAATLRTAIAFRDVGHLTEARHQAVTDDLTALPNRRLFMRRVADEIASAQAARGTVSVLMIDLDNFKQLNDTLGHGAGDALLQAIGPRLSSVVRATDTVARLGGDEFAILLVPGPHEAGAVRVAEKVLDALRAPFDIQGLSLRTTGSVGIATFPDHASSTEELMKSADVAMYQAKTTRSGYACYSADRDENSRERLTVVADLADAIEGEGIEVHFQPKADAVTRLMKGAEALVRWRHPSGRLVSPAEFLPAAEQAGLTRNLTRRVLTLALDQLAAWRRDGRDLDVSVNITAADLLDTSFPAELEEALALRGLPAESLVLEVTETSIFSDPERMGNVLAQIGESGIRLSLDDFGTGYSSLAHLRELPVGEVKIDRSFVSRMREDHTDMAIVYATVQLAAQLGMSVVAEGVEDTDTWALLHDLGCELIQGYAFSRPQPARDLEALLPARDDGLALAAAGALQPARSGADT